MRRAIFWILLGFLGVWASEIETLISAEPPSAEEMVLRGRGFLLKAIRSGDTARVLETVSYLNGKYSEGLCPFSRMEKGLVYLQVGRYDSAMTELVRERRLFSPEARNAASDADRCALGSVDENSEKRYFRDELFLYLKPNFTWTEKRLDSLYTQVQKSGASAFYGDAAPAFLPVVFSASTSGSVSENRKFLEAGRAFVSKYPSDSNGVWLKRNFLETSEAVPEKSDDAFLLHRYGNGAGFEFLSGIGFLTGDFKDEFHHRAWNYYAAIPIQLFRLTFTPFVSFGRLETRSNRRFEDVLWEKDSELSFFDGGMTLGYVVWESRFFKFEPFVGVSTTELFLPESSDDYYYYADRPNNNYHRLRKYVDHQNSIAYLVGATGEFRLVTIYSKRAAAPMSSISLRVKYLAGFLDHDLGYKKFRGVSHRILAGIGFFIW